MTKQSRNSLIQVSYQGRHGGHEYCGRLLRDRAVESKSISALYCVLGLRVRHIVGPREMLSNFSGDVLGSVPTVTHRKLGAEFFAHHCFSLELAYLLIITTHLLVLVRHSRFSCGLNISLSRRSVFTTPRFCPGQPGAVYKNWDLSEILVSSLGRLHADAGSCRLRAEFMPSRAANGTAPPRFAAQAVRDYALDRRNHDFSGVLLQNCASADCITLQSPPRTRVITTRPVTSNVTMMVAFGHTHISK